MKTKTSKTQLIKTKNLILKPKPKNWVEEVAGTGKGMWGKSSKYLEKERNTWNK